MNDERTFPDKVRAAHQKSFDAWKPLAEAWKKRSDAHDVGTVGEWMQGSMDELASAVARGKVKTEDEGLAWLIERTKELFEDRKIQTADNKKIPAEKKCEHFKKKMDEVKVAMCFIAELLGMEKRFGTQLEPLTAAALQDPGQTR